MAQQMNQCERMGVNPKWPSYKSVLGRIAKVPDHEDFYRKCIREYVTREDMAATKQIPNTESGVIQSLHAQTLSCTRSTFRMRGS